MGRLIPAGTGMARYQKIGIQIDAPEELLEGPEEELVPLAPPAVRTEDEAPGDALLASGGGDPDPLET
jgi:hypothetical protein